MFRGPRSPADLVPPAVLPRDIAAQVGLDLQTSRLARTYEKDPIYLVSSSSLVCTYSPNRTIGNCWSPESIRSGLATATSICGLGTAADEILTYGMVPDGVTKVTILRRDEPDRTVPVVGNVYVGATSSRPLLPLRIKLHDGDREVLRPSGIPADVAREGCRDGK